MVRLASYHPEARRMGVPAPGVTIAAEVITRMVVLRSGLYHMDRNGNKVWVHFNLQQSVSRLNYCLLQITSQLRCLQWVLSCSHISLVQLSSAGVNSHVSVSVGHIFDQCKCLKYVFRLDLIADPAPVCFV